MMAKKLNNSKNKLQRIGEDFNDEIEEIKNIRLENGMDKKRKSTRRLTNLIIKHQGWEKIKQDTIDIKLEGVKDE